MEATKVAPAGNPAPGGIPHVVICPRCQIESPDVAQFCRQCGLALKRGANGILGAGHAPHPDALRPPEGFERVGSGVDLYHHAEALSGGEPLLGTETLALKIFNAGYNLAQVELELTGIDKHGNQVFVLTRDIEHWHRGEQIDLEVASWEMPEPIASLRVKLIQAAFGPYE